jgi:hypothetical protein
VPTTSYMDDVVGTYNWRVADAMGTSIWWILVASIVDSTLAVGPEHLDTTDVVGISIWRVTDIVGTSSNWRVMGTSSNWRVIIVVGVVGDTSATSALAAQVWVQSEITLFLCFL